MSEKDSASVEKRVEDVESLTIPAHRVEVDTSDIDEKKLLRKLDWALIPWLSFLYLLSFLDRTSIGNAKVRNSNTHQGARECS